MCWSSLNDLSLTEAASKTRLPRASAAYDSLYSLISATGEHHHLALSHIIVSHSAHTFQPQTMDQRRHRDRQIACYCFGRCAGRGERPNMVIARTRDKHLAADEETLDKARDRGISPPIELETAIENNRCSVVAEAIEESSSDSAASSADDDDSQQGLDIDFAADFVFIDGDDVDDSTDSGLDEEDVEVQGLWEDEDDLFDEGEMEDELDRLLEAELNLDGNEDLAREEEGEGNDEDGGMGAQQQPHVQSRHGQDLFDALAGDHRPGACPQDPPSVDQSAFAFLEQLTPSKEASVRHLRTSLRTTATKAQYREFGKDKEAANPDITIYGQKRSTSLIKSLTRLREYKWDMCPDSCMAFTGHHSNKTHCTSRRNGIQCRQTRYDDSGKPRRQYTTFSILPRVRARFASGKGSTYLHDLAVYSDLTWDTDEHQLCDWSSGAIHRDLRAKGLFDDPEHDAYIISVDGAQFIDKRSSSGWIVMLAALNSNHFERFRHSQTVIPTVIPGPNSPVDLDSFLFPILQQFARAAQGHWIWDGAKEEWFLWRAWIVAAAADQQGSSKINHMTGPTGFCGCKTCHMKANYAYDGQTVGHFPLKTVAGAERSQLRPDYDSEDLPCRTDDSYAEDLAKVAGALTAAEHKDARRVTGVGKRPLLSFSPAFTMPTFFPPDVFHLFGSNIPSLLWSVLADPQDGDPFSLSEEQQELFAEMLESSASDLPTSFSASTPRDPCTNSNSHYKMFEWSLVTYLYLPSFLSAIDAPLPVLKMVTDLQEGVRLAMTDRGLFLPDLYRMRAHFSDFVKAWERLYIRNRPHLLHRATISIHQLLHIAQFFYAHGSPRNTSQARCEREVGLLIRMLRSHKQPFAGIINHVRQNEHLRLLDLLLDDREDGNEPPPFTLSTRISPRHEALTRLQRTKEAELIELFQQLRHIPNSLPHFVRRGKVKLSTKATVRGSRIESAGMRNTSRFAAHCDRGVVYGQALHFLSFDEQPREVHARQAEDGNEDEEEEVAAGRAFVIFQMLEDLVAADGIIRGRWQEHYSILDVRSIIEPIGIFELGGYIYVLRHLSWLSEHA